MSLISHYKLNDNQSNTNVIDSLGVNNGTLIGGNNTEDISVVGKINSALEFDGIADYVDCGVAQNCGFATGDFSLAFWIKINNVTKSVAPIARGG